MKKIKSLVSLLLPCLMLLGCATTLSNQEQLDLALADARDIAALGTQAALLENPNYRKELELTRDSLHAIASLPEGKATIDDLTAALAKLPIKELKSAKGQLYITGGRITVRRFTQLITKPDFDVGASGAIQKFAVALRDGMNEQLL